MLPCTLFKNVLSCKSRQWCKLFNVKTISIRLASTDFTLVTGCPSVWRNLWTNGFLTSPRRPNSSDKSMISNQAVGSSSTTSTTPGAPARKSSPSPPSRSSLAKRKSISRIIQSTAASGWTSGNVVPCDGQKLTRLCIYLATKWPSHQPRKSTVVLDSFHSFPKRGFVRAVIFGWNRKNVEQCTKATAFLLPGWGNITFIHHTALYNFFHCMLTM